MSIRAGIFFSYLLIALMAFISLAQWLQDELRPRYLESIEESLVDTSSTLAAWAAETWTETGPDTAALQRIAERLNRQHLAAEIYGQKKSRVDMGIYITDDRGILLFDSRGLALPGSDYSRWRDVKLTLEGKYGARSSKDDPDNPLESILYIAAPVSVDGKTVGVLTVCKPTRNLNQFIHRASRNIVWACLIAGSGVVITGLLLSYWLTGPIRSLTRYAHAIRDGKRPDSPRLGFSTEIQHLGDAFEEMRDALEGRRYVERYVQALAHEIKSPISSIRGAAELLSEEMPAEQRQKFLDNICREVGRIGGIIEKLMTLTALESAQELSGRESVDLQELTREVIRRFSTQIEDKRLTLVEKWQDHSHDIHADRFLISQAITNLLQNAIEFSPTGAEIILESIVKTDSMELRITDHGPGIPEYARSRVFERFYSLPRPDTQAKSSGLGLNLVQEIALLHQGRISLQCATAGGTCATLQLPYSA
ncbi:MAG: two-component system sensor histidine kinase CreC [Verrucomicrobiota bacterium]